MPTKVSIMGTGRGREKEQNTGSQNKEGDIQRKCNNRALESYCEVLTLLQKKNKIWVNYLCTRNVKEKRKWMIVLGVTVVAVVTEMIE